jgi:hypothetical protein
MPNSFDMRERAALSNDFELNRARPGLKSFGRLHVLGRHATASLSRVPPE